MNTFQRTTLKDLPLRSAFVTEAVIVSHMDPNYMGTLTVELISYRGSNPLPERTGQLMTVRYLSPFYGVTPLKGVQPNDAYRFTQQSYGFWAIPPDVGTRVLVLFAEGHAAYGYWIGCIPDEGMNFMVPDPRTFTEMTTPTVPENLSGQKLPTGEYNKLLENGESVDYNFFLKPYNKDFTEVLEVQGLLYDENRGLSTSSARREAPSMVFGWSSPGPKDKRTGSPDTTYGDSENASTDKYSRLGGSSIVMDDGDDKLLRTTHASEGPPLYVNKETGEEGGDETIPHGEGIRIRTRTGHQILLSNNEDLIYVGNSRGTAWIEITSDGKLDIHCDDSISVHTEQDFNLVAERDINMEAGRNVNIKAAGRWNEYNARRGQVVIEANKNFIARHGVNSTAFSISGDNVDINVPNKLRISSGKDLHISAGGSMYTTSVGSMQQNSGKNILRTAKLNMVDQSENTFMQVGNGLNMSAGGDIREHAGGIKNIKSSGSLFIQSDGDVNFVGGNDIKTMSKSGTINMNSNIKVPSDADFSIISELHSSAAKASGAQTPGALTKIPQIRIRAGSYDPITFPPYESIVPRIPQHEPWPHHENFDPLSFKYPITDREILSSIGGYEFYVHAEDGSVQAVSGTTSMSGTTRRLTDEEVQRILNSEESDLARAEAEKYLGREMSDEEWAALLSATVAESLPDSPEEQAAVMAVILNRVKSPSYPDNVIDVLYQPNQFQAVTGAAGSGPSTNYTNPSDAQLASTITGVNEYLSSSNTTWLNFTSNNPAAYGAGTNINFLYDMRSSPGATVIGGTVFGTVK